jgi:hypothetical protein
MSFGGRDRSDIDPKAVSAMSSTSNQLGSEEFNDGQPVFDDIEKQAVLRELNAILNSPVFHPSRRGQQFLSYVVRHRLEGNQDRLKERTIGVDLFQRPPGYATGDDPVVRVQAGEVRRRLDQYYRVNPNTSEVRIELHVGSYTPEFKWMHNVEQIGQPLLQCAVSESEQAPQRLGNVQELKPIALPPPAETKSAFGKHRWLRLAVSTVGVVILAGLVLAGLSLYRAKMHRTVLQKFWAPALSSAEPVLICLAKPSVYRPSVKLYQRHSKNPDEFLGQFARLTNKPQLLPGDKLTWSDMEEYPDYGLASGDVYTAIQLLGLFGQVGKKNQVRIGGDYSFEDLRSSPAVVIGAFNNRWTMQMTSNLHFSFADKGDESIIREEGTSGRQWYSRSDSSGKALEDYAVVTRLLNSRTGQFAVFVAGIKSYGTQAAGEFVSNPESLKVALQALPAGWENKNLQFVLQTPVTDGLPSAAQVVAYYVW